MQTQIQNYFLKIFQIFVQNSEKMLLALFFYRAITLIGFRAPEAPIACLFRNACLLEIGTGRANFLRKHFFGLYAPLGGHPSHAYFSTHA